jgi:hypothetical protein
LPLEELLPDQDVEGQTYARAEVEWSGNDWNVEGRTEVFGLRAGDQIVPILGSEFSLDANRLIARDVRGLVQATPIRGNVTLDLKTNELDGSVLSREFFVADWLPDLNVKGTARLLATRIRGTLDDPVIEALVSLRDIGYGQFDSRPTRRALISRRLRSSLDRVWPGAGAVTDGRMATLMPRRTLTTLR